MGHRDRVGDSHLRSGLCDCNCDGWITVLGRVDWIILPTRRSGIVLSWRSSIVWLIIYNRDSLRHRATSDGCWYWLREAVVRVAMLAARAIVTDFMMLFFCAGKY